MIEKLPRYCDECGKNFKPMTDALWRLNKFQHDLMSSRHSEQSRQDAMRRFREKQN